MKLRFTKMHGAGNDFVVLDATRGPLPLSTAQYRFIADRRFGIGADQILVVEPHRAGDDTRRQAFGDPKIVAEPPDSALAERFEKDRVRERHREHR